MKIGILTIDDKNNYGNRLQNYATQFFIKERFNIESETIKNESFSNNKKYFLLHCIKNINYKGTYSENEDRKKNFMKFNDYISYSKNKVTAFSKINNYDYVLVGSDQVWNPTFGRLRDVDLLSFVTPEKRISFSASFGIESIPHKFEKKVTISLKKFKAISVREDVGKKIIQELTCRNDVEVLIDPTMLLTAEEWDEVSKRPKMLKSDKYILNYFLGNLSDERTKEIERIAKENSCEIINILDRKSPFYECGPSEFLYLEKNAFLICTDSFHSSVFGILYNTPFLVFEREDNNVSMNSRLDTLLSKFKLENRRYKGKITKKDLSCNYTEAHKILEKERIKSMNFLKKALDIKDSENDE